MQHAYDLTAKLPRARRLYDARRERKGGDGVVAQWTNGSAAVPVPGPNTLAAPSYNCSFHAVIWLTCGPTDRIAERSPDRPFMAASATFALKSGEGSGVFASSSSLLIRTHNRARYQAEIPLIAPTEIVEPPQSPRLRNEIMISQVFNTRQTYHSRRAAVIVSLSGARNVSALGCVTPAPP